MRVVAFIIKGKEIIVRYKNVMLEKVCLTAAQGPEYGKSLITKNNHLIFYIIFSFRALCLPFCEKHCHFKLPPFTLRTDLATSPASAVKQGLKLSMCKLH